MAENDQTKNNPQIQKDPHEMHWLYYQGKPPAVTYLILKLPFVIIISVLSYVLAWKLVDQIFAVILTFFMTLSGIIFFTFLGRADYEDSLKFKIDKNGINVNKKIHPYSSLDKGTIINQVKNLILPENEWSKDLDKNSDINLGKIKLKFANQSIRQKAIQSLLYFLQA